MLQTLGLPVFITIIMVTTVLFSTVNISQKRQNQAQRRCVSVRYNSLDLDEFLQMLHMYEDTPFILWTWVSGLEITVWGVMSLAAGVPKVPRTASRQEKHYAEFAKVFEHFDDDQSGTLEAMLR